MCCLKIKIRIIGKKNHGFVRFILIPKKRRQRGKFITTLGYWDIRQNNNIRVIVFDIYLFMRFYSFGAIPTKNTLRQISYFFLDVNSLQSWFYFNDCNLRLLLENEIKKKY